MATNPKAAAADPAAAAPAPAPPDPQSLSVGEVVAAIVPPTVAAAARSAEVMYEVLTDTWGARAPIFQRGDTFVADMAPGRDLVWAEQQMIIGRVPDGDPRLAGPPTGPTGDQSGVPGDGWFSPAMPHQVPDAMINQVAMAMRLHGATEAQIAAVTGQIGTSIPLVTTGAPVVGAGRAMAPQPGQAHVEVPTGI